MRLWAVVNDDGTAMQEAVLCEEHWAVQEFRSYAELVARDAEDLTNHPTWVEATGNDQLLCVECGVDTFGIVHEAKGN